METPDAPDLVEDSIRVLDTASLTDARFRADVAALYDFQSEYESRPTYFRLMDLLERRGYFVTLDLERHPDCDDSPEVFEELGRASVSPVFRRPADEWSEEDNPVVGYASGETLYVRRGGELWKRLLREGVLEGVDAELQADVTLHEAVADVVEAAFEEDDVELVLRWYIALGFHLAFQVREGVDEEELLEDLEGDAALDRIRTAVDKIENLEMKLAHPERALELPPPALRGAHSVLGWWYDLL